MNKDNLSRCVEHLCVKLPAIAIYLFGSQASETPIEWSDYDLAILYDDQTKLDPLYRYELQEELSEILRSDVDLVFLNDAGPVIAMQIVTKGKLIYEDLNRKHDHNAFVMHLFSQYAEFKELIAPMIRQIHERWSEDR
ncbi:MAG: nucleotidyltransferase domain-containing protein [Chlamydiia bacterium]|nr:nucleotidyltransferase domain-containing protein [Chlamydiia bacterium]